MTNEPNNEPAFPVGGTIRTGMSKRFYAAVQIAAGWMSTYPESWPLDCEEGIARNAFILADALLKAEQEGGKE